MDSFPSTIPPSPLSLCLVINLEQTAAGRRTARWITLHPRANATNKRTGFDGPFIIDMHTPWFSCTHAGHMLENLPLGCVSASCISLNAVLLRHLIAALRLPRLCPWGEPSLSASHTNTHGQRRTHTHTHTQLSSRHNLPTYLTPKQTLPLLCQCTHTGSRSAPASLISYPALEVNGDSGWSLNCRLLQ